MIKFPFNSIKLSVEQKYALNTALFLVIVSLVGENLTASCIEGPYSICYYVGMGYISGVINLPLASILQLWSSIPLLNLLGSLFFFIVESIPFGFQIINFIFMYYLSKIVLISFISISRKVLNPPKFILYPSIKSYIFSFIASALSLLALSKRFHNSHFQSPFVIDLIISWLFPAILLYGFVNKWSVMSNTARGSIIGVAAPILLAYISITIDFLEYTDWVGLTAILIILFGLIPSIIIGFAIGKFIDKLHKNKNPIKIAE